MPFPPRLHLLRCRQICLFMLGFTRVTNDSEKKKEKRKKKKKEGRMYLEMLVKRFLTHPVGVLDSSPRLGS